MRFILRPLCLSFALCRWPCITVSLIPMIAGQAAVAVRSPRTIVIMFCVVVLTSVWRWTSDDVNISSHIRGAYLSLQ